MTSIDKISRAAPSVRTERRRALRDLDPSLGTAGVWLIVPCYKVKAKILDVIAKTPPWIEGIVCVDDACPEGSGDFIEANNKDPRVVVVRLPQNQGVGGATLAGYREAVARGGQVLVKVDGDDQMDLGYISHLVAPILLGEADYAKGKPLHLDQPPDDHAAGAGVRERRLSFRGQALHRLLEHLRPPPTASPPWRARSPDDPGEAGVAPVLLRDRPALPPGHPCGPWCAMCRCRPATPTRSRTCGSAPSWVPSR